MSPQGRPYEPPRRVEVKRPPIPNCEPSHGTRSSQSHLLEGLQDRVGRVVGTPRTLPRRRLWATRSAVEQSSRLGHRSSLVKGHPKLELLVGSYFRRCEVSQTG